GPPPLRALPRRGGVDDQKGAALFAELRGGGPAGHAVVARGGHVGGNGEEVEDVGLAERIHPGLGCAVVAGVRHLRRAHDRAVGARGCVGGLRGGSRRRGRAEPAVDAQELRLLLENLHHVARARGGDRDVEKRLARPAAAALHQVVLGGGGVEHLQVEQRIVGGVLGLALVLHRDAQVHAPAAWVRGLELAARERERRRGRGVTAGARGASYDDRRTAPVGEEW